MKNALLDLFASKKFLAALTAIIVYVAGRFGFKVDTAVLDRIFAALLVYIGAQGIADNGKSAAQIAASAATTASPAPSNSAAPRLSGASITTAAALLLAIGLGSMAAGCGPARNAGNTVIHCLSADRAKIDALLADLGTKTRPDGTRDWDAIETDAISAGVVIGGCALAELIESILPPAQHAATSSDDTTARQTFEHFRSTRAGNASFKTPLGTL